MSPLAKITGKPTRRRPKLGPGPKGRHRGGRGSTGGLPDTWVDGHAASYRVMYVNCGRCPKKHGPYTYLKYRSPDGRMITKYVGRA